MPEPRQVVKTARFQEELDRILAEIPRADEAFRGFEHAVARIPEHGMTVPGRPAEFRQRPFHTPEASYTVIYTFDDENVVCLSLRRVPSGPYA